jgi:hypothetical protein
MHRITIAAVCAFAVISFAHAQKGGRQPSAPKPTKAEIEKVIQIVSGSKEKTQQYCDLGKINQQMAQADQKNDTKALEALDKRADELEEKIGPEFVKFMDALDQADDSSAQDKDLIAAVETLDKLCPEK